MRKTVIIRSLNFGLACAALVLGIGATNDAAAQERDPFRKPMVAAPRKPGVKTPGGQMVKPVKAAPTAVQAPPIQQRIENYKILRMRAAELGLPAPKPTAVLTVNEVEVTGVFRTPRGYSAMVEAVPIKLSYTVYPGEKFYDGYLVAIEENRLVFRRETKMTDGKTVTVAENKGLKVEMLNDMLVPRAETAENRDAAAPVTVNPTATVPASNNQQPVVVADNKSKPERGVVTVQGEKSVSAADETSDAESGNNSAAGKSLPPAAKKPAPKVNPRKSK